MSLTQTEIDSKRKRLECCSAHVAYDLLKKEQYNSPDKDCLYNDVKYLHRAVEALKGYTAIGTVVITDVDACATVDFTSLVDEDLGDGMVIDVISNIGGVSTLIVSYTANFADVAFIVFLSTLADQINNSGTGYTATVVGNTVVICVPHNLGANPIGETITVSFPPYYYLRSERTSPTVTGFTTGIGFPAYVNNPASNAYRYLYVTNANRLEQSATVDYTGTVIGNTRTFPVVAGINAAVLAIGNTIILESAVHTITGVIIAPGYVGTTLTFQVTAISAGSGNELWNLRSDTPNFGSINVFQWDSATPPNGALTFLQTIYTPLAMVRSCFYDIDTDAIYASCIGFQGIGTGVIRIDCSSPFAVAASTNITPLQSANLLVDNPTTENLYISGDGFSQIAKLNKALGPVITSYNALSNITITSFLPPIPPGVGNLYFSRSHAKTVNPSNGIVYYSQYFSDEYRDYVLQLNPTFIGLDAANKDVPSIFFQFSDSPNGESGAGVYDMYYHAPTQRLFVARYLITGKYFFQSYDISSGDEATILLSKLDHPTPTNVGPGDGLCSTIINYQPGHNRILIANETIVFIFNPDTLQYENSSVSQPNFAENFSRTDDMENDNFYASGGTGWLSVISYTAEEETFEGEFEGEVTSRTTDDSENCLTEEQMENLFEIGASVCCSCCSDDQSLVQDI